MASGTAQTIRCPHCAETLSPGAQSCKSCGQTLSASSTKSSADFRQPAWVRQWQKWSTKAMRAWRLVRKHLLEQPNQQWWDMTAMLGGGMLGTLWAIYSAVKKSSGGGTTAILIVLLPVVITKARKRLDEWLRPLQKVRRRLPQSALI